MLRVLLDTGEHRLLCQNEKPMLLDSVYGVAVSVSASQEDAPHVDKLLAVLGEIGIPRSTSVRTQTSDKSVADVLADSVARFQLGQSELEWTAVAYSSYLPPSRSWVNRFGERFTFDDLADALLQRPEGEGPCYGTHVLYALNYLIRIDEACAVLEPVTVARIRQRLQQASMNLENAQYSTGAWSEDWHVPRGEARSSLPEPPLAAKNIVRASGHHLEWIALAPYDVRPSQACVARASSYLLRRGLSFAPSEIGESYGPLTHAARALCLLHNQDWRTLVENASGILQTSRTRTGISE
jgi:hypothetical protein